MVTSISNIDIRKRGEGGKRLSGITRERLFPDRQSLPPPLPNNRKDNYDS